MNARVALLVDNLSTGGAQRMTLALAGAMAQRGVDVDLLVCAPGGDLAQQIPPGVHHRVLDVSAGMHLRRLVLRRDLLGAPAWWRVINRQAVPRALRTIPALTAYLRECRPAALIANKTFPNLAAAWARREAGVPTRLVLTERTHLTARAQGQKGRWAGAPALVRRYYGWADAVVAVSAGVAADLARVAPRARLLTIHNPVVGQDFAARAGQPVAHPWLATADGGPPVLLAVGGLTTQKDYPTLLHAFARLRARRPARLLILGEGPARESLLGLTHELGIASAVSMPGTVACPEAYMARAAALVLSSRYEGFGNVLVEALAAGCPVVSTDCPSGPAEILDHGRFGRLVPVGDAPALARALDATLDARPDRTALRTRAGLFSVARATAAYLRALGMPEADASYASAGARPALALER